MSAPMHTPGPWVLGRIIGGYIDIDAPNAPIKWTALARVVVETEAVNGYSRNPEADANARLIAAAPAMFDALLRIAANAEDGLPLYTPGAMQAMALAAIAKAKGAAA